MRIVLLYPPPWKIPAAGEPVDTDGEGPPPGLDTRQLLSGDILNIPYGLLSLAAQSRRAGYDVTVLNLFSFAWTVIEQIISAVPADLFGLSCFTSNRRGTLGLARLIRQLHPTTHIAVGGPHATALSLEILRHAAAIDTVVIGEGEQTFLELAACLAQRTDPDGIAGTARCRGGAEVLGRPRQRIADLDGLAVPCEFFNEYILMTSRGCAWDCAFCASSAIWGRTCRRHSPEYILDMLDAVVNCNEQKAVAIKDETFTQNREQVLALCKGIRERRLSFLWSCDTRADALDDELLYALRSAGCQRISIGVESGSPDILAALQKQIDLETVRRVTGQAKRFGLQIRFYMIVGSPGETLESLRDSLDFVAALQPNQVVYSPFTLLPGTHNFLQAEQAGRVSREQFFTEDFFEMSPLQDAAIPEQRELRDWILEHSGLQEVWSYGVEECTEILSLFPDHSAAWLDLAGAHYRQGQYKETERCCRRAQELGYPLPGLIYNYYACCALNQGEPKGMLENLIQAGQAGFHDVVEQNIEAAQNWIKAGGPDAARPLELRAGHDFEVTRPLQQPMTPGRIVIQ
ncbi:MAG: B12-binding domain-containing radical SAM protein, partial [Deltaproteobacteria bacterium]|nr:B12-binding domain-containing radical SAM protein [Deltaproteobacteria bacterium]